MLLLVKCYDKKWFMSTYNWVINPLTQPKVANQQKKIMCGQVNGWVVKLVNVKDGLRTSYSIKNWLTKIIILKIFPKNLNGGFLTNLWERHFQRVFSQHHITIKFESRSTSWMPNNSSIAPLKGCLNGCSLSYESGIWDWDLTRAWCASRYHTTHTHTHTHTHRAHPGKSQIHGIWSTYLVILPEGLCCSTFIHFQNI